MMQKSSDRWIPWYFVIFFVILAIILIPMCVIAFRTYTGIVTDNAYEKGLAYNKTIKAAQKEAALGWHGDLAIKLIRANGIQADFFLKDATDKPMDNAKVKLTLVRPAQAGLDQTVALKALGNGRYGAGVALPAHGLWDAYISALADGQDFQLKKRVVIQ